jgi:hypothetical protein
MPVFIKHSELNQYIYKYILRWLQYGIWQQAYWDPALLINIKTNINN